jgi:hypothetical protein
MREEAPSLPDDEGIAIAVDLVHGLASEEMGRIAMLPQQVQERLARSPGSRPRVRMNLDVDGPWPPQMVAEEPSGTLQYQLFIALHIDLEDVQPSVRQNGIQANHPDHQVLSGPSIDGSHARLAAPPGSERDDTILTAHDYPAELNDVRKAIQGDMTPEPFEAGGVRLKRHHLAAGPNTLAQRECVQAHVGPDIGDDIAGPDTLH